MFGKVIYYDNDRIDEFVSLITGEKRVSVREIVHSSEKGGSIDIKVAGGSAKENFSYSASVKESFLLELAEFEKMLANRDDYLDFYADEYSLDAVGRGTLVKLWGNIFVPEEFDLHHTIKKFKPILVSSMMLDNDFDADDIMAMNVLISNDDDIKIPVVVEYEDHKLCSMLNSRYLSCTFEEFEDIEDEEVTILARMAGSGAIRNTKAYYDPLKDFISLNRTFRRSMERDRGEGLEPLYLTEDYYKIEIVAIFQ